MAVTSCQLAFSQPPASEDALGRWTVPLVYDIYTDGVMSQPAIVSAAESASPNPLPSRGATYSYQGNTIDSIYAQSRACEPVDKTRLQYRATVTFSPLPDDDDVSIFEPNPFLRGVIAWWDREPYNKFYMFDVDGKPVVNKCNRPYDILPEKQVHRGVLVCEFNVATLAQVGILLSTYQDAVNGSQFQVLGWTVPARCALCQDVASGPPIKEGAYTYYRVGMRIAFNGDTWDEPIIERGYQAFRRDATGNFVTDGAGNKLLGDVEPEPFNLDKDGYKLPDGQVAVVTKWRLNRLANFNTLFS